MAGLEVVLLIAERPACKGQWIYGLRKERVFSLFGVAVRSTVHVLSPLFSNMQQ